MFSVINKGPAHGKTVEDQLQIFDDLPSSAVELQVKDKVYINFFIIKIELQ